MTRDELIRDLEKCEYVNGSSGYKIEEVACKIALAALKAHKAGYQMYTYDYSERDWLPAECELTRLLEELE